MNILFFSLSLLLVFSAYAHEGHDGGEDHVHDDDVVVLTDDNFEETIKNNEFVLVEFYAPWCGHCKSLAPIYAQLATTLKSDKSPVVIAKLDATVHKTPATKHAVQGYPTLKFFRNGEPTDYEGGRELSDFLQFLKKKTGPASVHLKSQEELDNFKALGGTKIVAFLESDDPEEKETKKWFQAATASELGDFLFGHVTDSTLKGEHKSPSAVIYKTGEDPVVYTEDKWQKTKIVSWASAEGHPLLTELAQKAWQRSQTSNFPLLAAFIESGAEAQLALVTDLAKKFKGKVAVTYSYASSLAERWGASGKVFPTAIVVQWKDGEPKFVIFDEENEKAGFTAESGESFINKALAGDYKSYRKSEPVPAKNDDVVKVVVGKNFEEIVLDETKDVFVEFYAPWCGHCKSLAPIWEELGETFEDFDSVVIAKMDATANSAPDNVEIRGFPTLIFFPADNKAGVSYSGERDLPSLKKFVLENVSKKINLDGEKEEL